MECQLCYDTCQPIACEFCSYALCQSCAEYLVLHDAECPNCREFSFKNFLACFDETGFARYEAQRKEQLLSYEVSMLSETEDAVKNDEVRKKNLILSDLNHAWIMYQIDDDLPGYKNVLKYSKHLAEHVEGCGDIALALEDALKSDDERVLQPCVDKKPANRVNRSKCERCGQKTNGVHECDADDVKTFDFIKLDTKACPKCSVPIHKIEGCHQMFCVVCHTAFSWITETVITGAVHNPHYFDYVRSEQIYAASARTANELPSLMDIPPIIRTDKIVNFLKFLLHLRDEFVTEFRPAKNKLNERVRISHVLKGTDLNESLKFADDEARYVSDEFRCLAKFVDDCNKSFHEAIDDVESGSEGGAVADTLETTITRFVKEVNLKLKAIDKMYLKKYDARDNAIHENKKHQFHYNFPECLVKIGIPTKYLIQNVKLNAEPSTMCWSVGPGLHADYEPEHESEMYFGYHNGIESLIERDSAYIYL